MSGRNQESYRGFQSTDTIRIDPVTAMFNVFLSDGVTVIKGEGMTYTEAVNDARDKTDFFLKNNLLGSTNHLG